MKNLVILVSCIILFLLFLNIYQYGKVVALSDMLRASHNRELSLLNKVHAVELRLQNNIAVPIRMANKCESIVDSATMLVNDLFSMPRGVLQNRHIRKAVHSVLRGHKYSGIGGPK